MQNRNASPAREETYTMNKPIEVWRIKFELFGYGHNHVEARRNALETFRKANGPEENIIMWESLDYYLCGTCQETNSTRENAMNCCATPKESKIS